MLLFCVMNFGESLPRSGPPFSDSTPIRGCFLQAFLVEKEDGLDLVGNRTECALILMLKSLDIDYRSIRDAARIEAVGTFTAQRKMSSVLVKQEDTGTSECFCLHAKAGPLRLMLGPCIFMVQA